MISEIHHIKDGTYLGLSKITESLGELANILKTKEDISKFHPKKQEEYLASRALIKRLCDETGNTYTGIWKDEHGKPHLSESDLQISISHSHPWIACMISDQEACGLDIESPRNQLLRIRHKYLSDEEKAHCGQDLDKLCRYWAAKEAIYKIFGRMYLSFKDHIRLKDEDEIILATVRHGTVVENVNLTHRKVEDHHLVYGTL